MQVPAVLTLLFATTTLLGGCATASPAPGRRAAAAQVYAASAPAPAPAQGLRPFPVRALEGRFVAEVAAISQPSVVTRLGEDGKAHSTLRIPVGATEPIVCLVTSDVRDTGALVQRSFASVKKDAGLDGISAPEVKIEMAPHAPIVWASARGIRGDQALDLRAAVVPREGGSIFCLHVGALAAETFSEVVGGLVGSAKHEGWTSRRFAEAAVLRSNGKVCGLAQRFVHEGGKETLYATAFVDRGDSWAALDWANASTVDGKGELQTSTSIAAMDGNTVVKTEVTRGKGQSYAYSREVAGAAPVRGSFTAPRAITTDLSRAARVRTFLAGKEKELTFFELHEDPKVVVARPIVMRRVRGRTMSLAYGADKTGTCDMAQDGLCLREDITEKSGDAHAWERLFVEGEP